MSTEKMYHLSKTDLSKYDNSWYQQPPKWKAVLWFVTNALFVNSYLPIPSSVRCGILRLFGAKIGQGVMIKPKVNVKYPWFLSVGNYTWIGEEVWIDNLTDVTIGDHVCISQGAMLLTGNHDYSSATFDLKVGKINLENGVWIGAKAIVCPGVRGGSHAVLAVGSVATKELKAYGIYQGNPAQLTRERVINSIR